MARKQTYTPPQSADLTLEQMKAALPRLELRISDIRDFDPKEVTKRGDPKIKALENSIDDFLTKTFGEGTARTHTGTRPHPHHEGTPPVPPMTAMHLAIRAENALLVRQRTQTYASSHAIWTSTPAGPWRL